VGPRAGLDAVSNSDHPTVQPVVSRCTDSDIQAFILYIIYYIILYYIILYYIILLERLRKGAFVVYHPDT
jgi:hypothetical protein